MSIKTLRLRRLVPLLFVALLAASCTSTSYQITQPATKNFSSFDGLVIKSFTSSINSEGSAQVTADAQAKMLEKIAKRKERYPEELFFTTISLNTAETATPLVVECTLVGFDEGNRVLRALFPGLAGDATAAANCTFNTLAGEKIAEVSFQGVKDWGVFGGSAAATMGALLDDMLGYMLLNY